MIPEDIEALALADAAGALDADEQRVLRGRLESLPPDVRLQVTRLYETALLFVPVEEELTPAPAVRERLLASLTSPANYTITAGDGDWAPSGFPGITVKVLAVDRPRGLVTLLLRGAPGARYPAHRHSAPEECYVIRGSVTIAGRLLHAGDFHHADANSDHAEITTVDGAEVLLVGAIDDYLPGSAHA